MRFPVKPKLTKTMATASCLVMILMTSVSLGCSKTELTFPTSLSELSLVQMWDKVLEVTDVIDQTADLQSLSLHAGETGTLELLSFQFYGMNANGKAKIYQLDVNQTGKSFWFSWDSDTDILTNSSNHPLIYFEELDKVGLGTIDPEEDGFSIWLDFQRGSLRYSHANVNTYHLKNGALTPLKEIVFSTNMYFGTIMVSKPAVTQFWFVTSDIGKATTVEYLET